MKPTTEMTLMLPAVTQTIQDELTPQQVHFWGKDYTVQPELVDEIFGDGAQVIGLSPLNTRPNYYVVRIDSTWSTNNHDWDKPVLLDQLEPIYEAIEEQYGRAHPGEECDCEDDDGNEVECAGCDDCGCACGHDCPVHHVDWPAFDDEVGTEWFWISGQNAHRRYAGHEYWQLRPAA